MSSRTHHDRKFSNFVIAPEKQLKMALGAVLVGLIFFFGIFGFQLWMHTALISSLMPLIPESSNVGEMIAQAVFWSRMIFGVGVVMFTFIVTSVTIVISHRIYGPVYAIRKHLAALTRGDYEYRTQLRKGDEFKDLAQDMNKFSETLNDLLSAGRPKP